MTERGESLPAFEAALESVPIGVVLLADDGEVAWTNDRAAELLGVSRSEVHGRRFDRLDLAVRDEDGDPVPPEDHPVSRLVETGEPGREFSYGITRPDGSDRWLSIDVTPLRDDDGSVEWIALTLDDAAGPERLEQPVDTFQPAIAALNRASTRDEAERVVCDRLTDTGAYDAAWLAEHTPDADVREPHVERGRIEADQDETKGALAESDAGSSPARIAVETGQIQVVRTSRSDSGFESWRARTRTRGYRGSAVVPVGHDGRTYGVLGLSTTRAGAFDSRERELLQTVADRLGQLLSAFDTEHRLHTDVVVELEFRCMDRGSLLVDASRELGCSIDVVDAIPASDDRLVYYASVRGASLDAFAELVEREGIDGRVRPIRPHDDEPGGEVELELRRQSLAYPLVTSGAVVTRNTATDGVAEVVCEVTAEEDIDSLVGRVTASFPDTTLVAKREYDRTAESGGPRSDRILADAYLKALTDRQRQVLRAAVYGGYFESPRRSTATEIADALSLTQTTVSHHLRAAQRTLFERMLDRL